MNGEEIGSVGVNLMWTVVPDTGDKRIRFIRSSRDLNNGIVSMNKGVNDKVKGDYNKVEI